MTGSKKNSGGLQLRSDGKWVMIQATGPWQADTQAPDTPLRGTPEWFKWVRKERERRAKKAKAYARRARTRKENRDD